MNGGGVLIGGDDLGRRRMALRWRCARELHGDGDARGSRARGGHYEAQKGTENSMVTTASSGTAPIDGAVLLLLAAVPVNLGLHGADVSLHRKIARGHDRVRTRERKRKVPEGG